MYLQATTSTVIDLIFVEGKEADFTMVSIETPCKAAADVEAARQLCV